MNVLVWAFGFLAGVLYMGILLLARSIWELVLSKRCKEEVKTW